MPEMMKMPLAFNKDTIRPEDITPFRCRIFGCKNLCCLAVKDLAEAVDRLTTNLSLSTPARPLKSPLGETNQIRSS